MNCLLTNFQSHPLPSHLIAITSHPPLRYKVESGKMRLFSGKKPASPTTSLDKQPYPQPYPGGGALGYNNDDDDDNHTYDADLPVPCPPHTTERKLVARIDRHVIPFLCILYLLAFLDRVNIANANVYGMSTQLGLDGDKYNVALVIFFVPYVLFEIPSK